MSSDAMLEDNTTVRDGVVWRGGRGKGAITAKLGRRRMAKKQSWAFLVPNPDPQAVDDNLDIEIVCDS